MPRISKRAFSRIKFHAFLCLFLASLLLLLIIADLKHNTGNNNQQQANADSLQQPANNGQINLQGIQDSDYNNPVDIAFDSNVDANLAINVNGNYDNDDDSNVDMLFSLRQLSDDFETASFEDKRYQSPIDIDTSSPHFAYDDSLLSSPLNIAYDEAVRVRLKNNGQSVIGKFHKTPNNFIKGGPLTSTYRLSHIICHWPSEHTVRGFRFAGELQLLHYNQLEHGSIIEAAKHRFGLVIVTIFLKLGQQNRELQRLVDDMGRIEMPGGSTQLEDKIDVGRLLPLDAAERYWTYVGSLTMQPYLEGVRWIVLANPVDISQQQLAVLHQLYRTSPDATNNDQGSRMQSNHRETMPLNERSVRASWPN